MEAKVPGALEKLFVFGVGTGPAALNVINTKLIQLLGDEQFVIDGVRDGFPLGAVA